MNFKDWMWTRKTTEEIRREAFQPNHDERECNAAEAAGVEAVPGTDGNSAQLDSARDDESEARASARVYLIRSPRVPLYPLALFFKSRGYRLRQDGRGYVEAIR